MITLDTTLQIPADVVFRQVGEETVLLNLASGKYYGLDDIGTRMWALLAQHRCLRPAYQVLLAEYEVEPERLQADLTRLVGELAAQGLVQLDEV